MNSLLTENQSFIDRINQLTPQTQRLWGKMDVAQMMAHCQMGLKSALGDIDMGKRVFLGYIFGAWAKKKMFSDAPIDRNLPTAPSFKMTTEKDFLEEKQKLIALIERFGKAGISGIADGTHAFFGKMTPEEWVILQSKHLDHHLGQFGV